MSQSYLQNILYNSMDPLEPRYSQISFHQFYKKMSASKLDRKEKERMRAALTFQQGRVSIREEIQLYGRGRHTPPLLRREPAQKGKTPPPLLSTHYILKETTTNNLQIYQQT